MDLLSILYIGDLSVGSNSLYRSRALSRLGHVVQSVDTRRLFSPKSNYLGKFHYLTGYRFRQRFNFNALSAMSDSFGASYDAVWIDSGAWFGPKVLDFFNKLSSCVILWNNDDPFGSREPYMWHSLKRAAHLYAHVATVRQVSASDFGKFGAKSVAVYPMGFDEVEHCIENANSVPKNSFQSEVSFVGTFMEDRDIFLLDLIKKGVPLAIWGNRYEKSRYWSRLRPYWRGAGISGPEYVASINRSKVSLGLLSRLNRDLYTTRSSEIPVCGGLFCGKRTEAHMKMFQEDVEAVFWDDSSECAKKCHDLLEKPQHLSSIKENGTKRIQVLGFNNELVCSRVLSDALRCV